jgi:hypothetical protein
VKAVAAFVVAATLMLPTAWAKGEKPALGIEWNPTLGARLAWVDPGTLALQPGRKVDLAGHTSPWSFSPDRTKLALAGDGATLRFVDARKLRVLRDVRLAASGRIAYLVWPRAQRLLALVQDPLGDSFVVVVDAARRRVLRTISLGDRPLYGAGRASDGFAFLLGTGGIDEQGTIVPGQNPATVGFVDAAGTLRSVALDGVFAGFVKFGDGLPELRQPGFAVDPAGERAFVVQTDYSVAEVDLRTLGVVLHRQNTRSLAKYPYGPALVARWLGNDQLAVAGTDAGTPVGLRLIDTRNWGARLVDAKIASFDVGHGVLAGTDNPLEYAPHHYSVYGLDGKLRYSLNLAAEQSLVVQRTYAYVCRGRGLMRVLDAATGATLHRFRDPQLPICTTLLYGQNSEGTVVPF